MTVFILKRGIGNFITKTAKLFSTIALVGLLAGCTTSMAGRKDLNDAKLKAPRQTHSDASDYSEIPPDERPF